MNAASKPELILLHGWGLGSAVWQGALPALERRFKVIPFSLPGYRAPETSQPGSRTEQRSTDTHPQTPHEQRPAGQEIGRAHV